MSTPPLWAGSIVDPPVTLALVSESPNAPGSSVSRRAASLTHSSSLGWVNNRPSSYLSGSKRISEHPWILCIQESGEPCLPPPLWAGSIIDPPVTLAEVSGWPSSAGSSVSRRAASLVPSSSLGWVNYRPTGYLCVRKRISEHPWILCIQESGEPCPLLIPGLGQ